MIIYLELIYEILITHSFSIISLIYAVILTILINFIKNKKIKLIIYIMILILFLIYFIYYNLMGNSLNITNIINSFKAFEFKGMLLSKLSIIKLLLFMFAIFIMYFEIKYMPKNNKIINIVGVLCIIVYFMIILLDKDGLDSKYNLYFKVNNNSSSVKEFGLLTSIKLDVLKKIFNLKDNYKVNIDSACVNDEMCEISEYLSKKDETTNNEYTGIFKDKNLIVFLAESFYPVGVSKELTPTLYKLVHDGFEFNNYYTPTYLVSTADSQFALDTSLMPSEAHWSMSTYTDNYFPYSYPNVFKNYKAYSYHNYDYDYYSRDKYMQNMGYNYLACNNGLEKLMNCNNFQNSDLEMVQSTISDYINDEKFVVYYTTMSGHANYNKDSAMVKKNYDLVKDLPYSDIVKYYIATQIELDRALEYLLNELNKQNKLDETVILLSGDHPPYTLTTDNINEVLDENKEDTFNYYKSNLIIYNNKVKYTNIEKDCSTLDILPTMLNLFGIEYDARLLMGTDIFSDKNGIVIFSNRSFIYNGIKYNSTNNYVNKKISNEDLEDIKNKIYEIYRYSRLILENDYYKYLK